MSENSDNGEEKDEGQPEEDSSGSMPFFQDMPPRHVKGSRPVIFIFILVAVLVPIVLGGIFYLLRTLVSPGY